MSLFREIYDIFIDQNVPISDFSVNPRFLYSHYQKELKKVYFDEIIVATKYEKILHPLEQYKFYGKRENAENFAKMYSEIFAFLWKKSSKNVVFSWVPMHWSRYFSRGFDHMKKIVKILAKNHKIPYKQFLGAKFTYRQSKLSREKRLKNRENTYFPKKIKNIPEMVILFDDVVSTGATINSCAKILKNMWVKNIIVCILATNF